jgi:plasmid stability protein
LRNYFTGLKSRLRRREPGDRHAIGRARDVIQAGLLAEGDRGRIAAMFAADTELQVRARRPAALRRDLDQLANALNIDC